jgi:epoxyqueuosine reductase
MSLTQIIKEKALELGFVAVGIASSEPFSLYAQELDSRPEMYAWGKELSARTSVGNLDLHRFVNPEDSLPGTKSLIVVTDSYFAEGFPPALAGKVGRCYLQGLFCPGDTVHSRRRKAFRKFLQGLGMKVLFGPAPARMAGARAGITNYGRNCFAFANEAAGESSFIVNEPFLVDRDLIPDTPTLHLRCPDGCRKCQDACPTGALYAPLKMDPRRCIAYQSYFNTGDIGRDLRPKMGTWVYGCDLCQESCPRNKRWLEKEKPVNRELLARAKDLALTTLLVMTQEHLETKVFPRFYYIRKENRKIWQRNAAVALGNQNDPDTLPVLISVLEDPEPLVRGHVAWALGRIGGAKARAALEKGRMAEADGKVREEIEEALRQS